VRLSCFQRVRLVFAVVDRAAGLRHTGCMTDAATIGSEILNLGELEERLAGTEVATSADTLKLLAGRHADFPVISRGRNGVPYAFDLLAVVAWLRQHRAALEAERQAREAAVDRL